ncbi:MAG: glycerol-3-phosphate 1-O-acyltransferase PlsY [Gemmatimonadaceae bacterium]|nr:glycerol-3-phosphate 1-O-acyltransferase PlsY [Gemmatimonadaceae bacterium]
MNAQVAGGLALAASYAAGSFPSAYLAGRITKGIDLRTVGSGNLGTTNVYRELGVGPALAVLAVDGMKGALPAALFPPMIGAGGTAAAWWALACGATAIAGHARSMFLLWKGGGKGVATAAGVFLAVTPYATLAAIAAFIIVVAATRYASLGSLVGGVVVPVAEWLRAGPTPAFFAGIAVAAFIAFTHRSNIQRLVAGTERRIGRAGGRAAP